MMECEDDKLPRLDHEPQTEEFPGSDAIVIVFLGFVGVVDCAGDGDVPWLVPGVWFLGDQNLVLEFQVGEGEVGDP